MAYTLVTVPVIDLDFRNEENWGRREADSIFNTLLVEELSKQFGAAAHISHQRVRTNLDISARLPSGKTIEGFTNHSIEEGLVAFLDASDAKDFVLAYIEKSHGICLPRMTKIYKDFDPQDWDPS